MAKSSGLAMAVSVDDATGTPRNISNDVRSVQVGTPRGVQDVTGVDKAAMERILLTADGTVNLSGIWNTAPNMSHATLSSIPSTSVNRTVALTYPGPAVLSMEMVGTDYSVSRGENGELTWSAPFQLANGAVPTWS